MFTSATQLSNATKASIDSHLAALNEFAAKALTTVAEVAELNMATAKASLEHASAAAKQVLAAKPLSNVLMIIWIRRAIRAYGRIKFRIGIIGLIDKLWRKVGNV